MGHGATQDRAYSASYKSALRDAGYRVTVVSNQGKGAAAARIEAARQIAWSVPRRREARFGAGGWMA